MLHSTVQANVRRSDHGAFTNPLAKIATIAIAANTNRHAQAVNGPKAPGKTHCLTANQVVPQIRIQAT